MLKIQTIYSQFHEAAGPLPEYYKKKKKMGVPQQRGPRGQFTSPTTQPIQSTQPTIQPVQSTTAQPGKPGVWDRLRGAWDSFKNPTQQTNTPQTPQALISPKELATSLQKATKEFATAYNKQIRPYKVSIEIINNAVKGLLSMPPYQQLNPQIGTQVQEFVTILQNATQQQAIDTQFIGQVSQKAQSLSKLLVPQQTNKAPAAATPPLAAAASILTPRTGTPSFILKLKY